MTKCKSCNTELATGAKFCQNCGNVVEQTRQDAALSAETRDSVNVRSPGAGSVYAPSINFSQKGDVKRYCSSCDLEISLENRPLVCSKCGVKFCENCEGFFRTERKRGEKPLCEKCFEAYLVESQQEVLDKTKDITEADVEISGKIGRGKEEVSAKAVITQWVQLEKPTPVISYKEVIESVSAFNESLKGEKELQNRLLWFRAWYYIPELDEVGPSKFIGYKNVPVAQYLTGENLDGKVTEVMLGKWFDLLIEGTPEANYVESLVERLVSRYNKVVNRRARFNAPRGWRLERGALVKKGEAKSETTRLSFTREELDQVLSGSDYSPEKLVALLERDFIKEFSSDAGVWEGYTIRQHILMVLRQFDKYLSHKQLPADITIDFFRVILALRDIGKPEAIRKGGKHLSAKFTPELMTSILGELGYNIREINIASALVSGNPIGRYLRAKNEKKEEIESSAEIIRGMANKADLPIDIYFELLVIFYMVEAASYTVDAGGKKSFDDRFIFDKQRGEMEFSPNIKRKIADLHKLL